jgi:hypothetical protein
MKKTTLLVIIGLLFITSFGQDKENLLLINEAWNYIRQKSTYNQLKNIQKRLLSKKR